MLTSLLEDTADMTVMINKKNSRDGAVLQFSKMNLTVFHIREFNCQGEEPQDRHGHEIDGKIYF